jgi:hypothetical protein
MRFIFITTFLVLQVSFCFSQGESYSSNNYIKMKVKYNDSEFSLYKEGKKTSVYAISFYYLWANKSIDFYSEYNDRSDLETKVLLESTEGAVLIDEFNRQRDYIKDSLCLLSVPLYRFSMTYDTDKSKIYILKPEKSDEIKLNKFQFEELVFDIPEGFEVSNNKISYDTYWNYYYFPISDTKTALFLEKNYKSLTMDIQFKITNVIPRAHNTWYSACGFQRFASVCSSKKRSM